MFEWDEDKRQGNITKHGIDFINACSVFDGRPVITQRANYPDEERYKTIAMVGERFMTVVWTDRPPNIRIISARSTRDGEKRAYQDVYDTRH